MWYNPKTGARASTNIEARALCPGWSAPIDPSDEQIKSQGFVQVTRTIPEFDPLSQEATETTPKMVNGVWMQQWIVTPLSGTVADANLNAARAAKIAAIDAARLSANFGTFTYDGNTFDCDALARSDMDATAGYIGLFGTFAPGWPGVWKTSGGQYVQMETVDKFKAFYQAFYDQGLFNLGKSEALKRQAIHATNTAELNAIRWDT